MDRPALRPLRASPGAPLANQVLRAYYFATPVFAVLDLVLGVNLRLAFFDHAPALRLACYGVAVVCAVIVARWPASAALVGLAESAATIVLLILGVGVAYLGTIDDAAAESALPSTPFSPAALVNLVLSASALTVSYLAAQARVSRQGF